jgi:hypothetical protein
MKEDLCQRVVRYQTHMGSISIDEINVILEEGFEITDIVPYMTRVQGYRSGIEINRILFHLTPSQRKTSLSYHYVSRDQLGEYVNKINEIIKQENEKDRVLLKIIPNEEIHEPMNGNGFGWGTIGISLFFING